MKNISLKKGGCYGIILLLITMSTMPLVIGIHEKSYFQNPLTASNDSGDNILANVEVIWPLWIFQPTVNFNNKTENKNFEFPEDNGSILLNFTVEWKHRLQYPLWFRHRWTHIEFNIYLGDEEDTNYIYEKRYDKWDPIFTEINDTTFESYIIYIDQKEYGIDPGWKVDKLETNNSTITLGIRIIVTGFPPFSCIHPLTFPKGTTSWSFNVSGYQIS